MNFRDTKTSIWKNKIMSLLNDSRAIFSAQNHTPSDSYCSLPVFRKWSLRSLPPPCWLLMPSWCTSVSLDTTTESWTEPLWNPEMVRFLVGFLEVPSCHDGSFWMFQVAVLNIYWQRKKVSPVIVEKSKLQLYIGLDNPSQIHRTKWVGFVRDLRT